MTHIHQVAVKEVTQQLINMLTNNIIEDNGTEGFLGWCADGEVFNNLHGGYFDEAMKLATEVAPIIDALTYQHLNFGY